MNEILTSLSNRSTGFTNQGLETGMVFSPWKESRDSATVRTLLGLRPQDNEYSLIGFLMTLEAFPDVKAAFNEVSRSYVLDMPNLITPTFSAGSLQADRNGMAKVIRQSVEWPVFHTMTLRYLSENRGIFSGGNNSEEIVVVSHSGLVMPEWPAWSGINGKIMEGPVFDADFDLTITHSPVGFPHVKLAEVMDSSEALRNMIATHGLEVPYYYADSPAEKVAVGLLAFGLSNKEVYPDV